VPAVIHQPHGHIFYGYWSRRRTAMFVALERVAAHWTDTLVALTPREIAESLERGIGRAAQYAVVPSPVPTAALRAAAPSRAAARARLGLADDAYVVAGVGRFVPIKGFDLLVAALPELVARVPGAQLLLIGDGAERGALEARAAALGVADHLHLGGAGSDVIGLLPAADVLAAPSRNEGMGRVLVEAMALGLPVVGTRVGGIADVILDGQCGLLVPPEDPGGLAEALVELGLDRARRVKLGEGARPRAEAFSTPVAAAAMRAVYDALVRARRLER
jgi:glycosyltransferase involved in cell wall biosynthesis